MNEPSPGLQGKPFFFDDHIVGAEHAAGSYTVTAQEIIEFALKWDPQPWHTDEAVARASHFGGLTACSAHIFSIFCITSQRWQSGVVQQAIAGLGFDEMRMHSPVYAGDTLRCISIIDTARVSRSKYQGIFPDGKRSREARLISAGYRWAPGKDAQK